MVGIRDRPVQPTRRLGDIDTLFSYDPTKESVESYLRKETEAARRAYDNAGPVCFVAGTQVWTPRGKVAIEEVRVGDEVVTYSLREKQLATGRVFRVHSSLASEILVIKAGESVIRVTGEHPFVAPDSQDWVAAKKLRVGDRVLSVDGTLKTVQDIDCLHKAAMDVYNISVTEERHYFVGQDGVLVHSK